MADTGTISKQQQARADAMRNARQRQMQMIQQRQQQSARVGQMTTINVMGMNYDNFPNLDCKDSGEIDLETDALAESFKIACRDGPLSTLQDIISSATRTPVFLHQGLCSAISAGNIETAHYLLSAGASIAAQTASFTIRSAPLNQQLPILELFSEYGWTPNNPEGALLLPEVVTNIPLLRWLLDHGADPNLAVRPIYRNSSGPEKHSCAALEAAARGGHVESVRILLEAGAEIRHGVPLHYAAGACPPGQNPHVERVRPSKEFDESRIPVMALLVDRGADVNHMQESQHMTARYAIVEAVMAGATKRVKWLLEKGADPEVKGAFGSAVNYAGLMGSEEMKKVIADGVMARRWVRGADET